jgi:hypothetical protein
VSAIVPKRAALAWRSDAIDMAERPRRQARHHIGSLRRPFVEDLRRLADDRAATIARGRSLPHVPFRRRRCTRSTIVVAIRICLNGVAIAARAVIGGTMRASYIVGGLLGAAVLASWAVWRHDPLHTALPFGTTDLSLVQAQLRRLPPAERALVEAYVKRSNGDVLPAKFADPDQPFTARTFADAIALEKAWHLKHGEIEAETARREAERDAAMAPLREAVEAGVVRTGVVAPRDLAVPPDPSAPVEQAPASDGDGVFVVTVSLHNLGSRTISAVEGSLEARDREAYLPLDLCWIRVDTPIEPASRAEIRCGSASRRVSDQQRAFIDDDAGRFTVVWNPKHVVFADGSHLDSGL